MVWGGICTKGEPRLKRIEGILDKKVYNSILVHRAVPEGKVIWGRIHVSFVLSALLAKKESFINYIINL